MVTKRKLAAIVAGLVVLSGLIAAAIVWWASPGRGPRLTPESSTRGRDAPDLPPVLVLLEPGTIVDGPSPPGWSDLVVKSITYLASGDLDTLPAFAKTSATRFRTVVLADIRRDATGGGYHLARVGAGLGVPLAGKDTIVSPESLDAQGVELSALDRLVLGRAERALGRSRLAAATPTFALYDTYVELADGDGPHRSILLRYAMVVDPASGTLQTVLWTVAQEPARREAPETLAFLPAGLVFRCGIHVAAHRVFGSFASSWGFAMEEPPPGELVPMPSSLQSIATGDPGDIEPEALERAVREAIGTRSAPLPR